MGGIVDIASAPPSVQAVQGGDAACRSLEGILFAAFEGVTLVNLGGILDEVIAPVPSNGTNTDGGTIVADDGLGNSVAIDLLRCEATRAPGFLSAEAEITGGAVTIGGIPIITLGVIRSEVLCPTAGTGAGTSDASGALTVGGELITLSAGASAEGFVDFTLPEIDGIFTVTAQSSATADEGSAHAIGLAVSLDFSGAAFGQSVAVHLGTITLAQTVCTAGIPDSPPGTTAPGTTTPGTTAPGITTPTGGALPGTR